MDPSTSVIATETCRISSEDDAVTRNPDARFVWLDALRGVAALAVVVYHARAILWVGLGSTWKTHGWHPDFNAALGYLTAPFSFGYLGVTLFFVVSGFSIHLRGARLLATAGSEASISWKTFFLRRFLRLYPTYVTVLLVVVVLDRWLMTALPEVVPKADFRLSTFIATLLLSQGFFTPHFASAGVFWSLVIEFHLYLAYPLLFHLSRRHGPLFGLLLTLAVSSVSLLIWHIFHVAEHWPFPQAVASGGGVGPRLFFNYWFTWTLGFYAAEVHVGRLKISQWLSPWTAGISAMCALILTALKLTDLAEPLFGIAFAWLLLACSHRPMLNALGTVRALALCGTISYSLYCIHPSVLHLTRARFLGGLVSSSVCYVACGTVASVAAATLLYVLVERRSIRWSSHAARQK